MRMYDIINDKKLGKKLSEDQINYFINGYVKGDTPDYQISALLMAICFNDLDIDESVNLTKAMIASGDEINLDHIGGITVDKHSTGGVGDKTSISLLPLLASFGLIGSKMSGRGLGHTGGTLDKLESIKGFDIMLSPEEAREIVLKNNFIICGQTANLVPADKKLYALRDVTDTVDNIGLISSSIMSKKIASGAKNIILDVKVGSGAFMKDLDSAIKLSKTMVKIGTSFGRNVMAVITNMDEPLGRAVGNSLEVMEAIDMLKNKGPEDFRELVIFLSSNMLVLTGMAKNMEEAKKLSEKNIENGQALKYFKKFIELQHGDASVVEDYDKFPKAKIIKSVTAKRAGYVEKIEAEEIGLASLALGAGREKKEDSIDYSAGIYIKKKVSDYVEIGDEIAVIYTNNCKDIEGVEEKIRKAYTVGKEKLPAHKLIYGIVNTEEFIKYE